MGEPVPGGGAPEPRRYGNLAVHGIILLLVFLTIYPFFYMLVSSMKTSAQISTEFWAFLPFRTGLPFVEQFEMSRVHFAENYSRAWEAIRWAFPNSFFVTTMTCLGVLVCGALSGYVFARHSFWGKEILYMAIISLMMVPGILTLVPGFMLVSRLGLVNSYWGVVLPYMAGGQVFAIFLFRSYFASLPEELFEAARLDGAGELRVLWSLALPLSMPIVGTISILNVLATWNDVIWPLLVLSVKGMRTVTIALLYFERGYRVEEGPLMAGNVIVAIPVMLLFLFTMRLFIQGITSGGIKA